MNRFTNNRLGAREVVLLLEELHKRGYERLRFFGYVSPNGMAYRVYLAHQDAVAENGYELWGRAIWYTSVGINCCGVPSEILADEFLDEFADHPDLLRAKAEDHEYVHWFEQVVELAQRDVFPSPYSEYDVSSVYKGYLATTGSQGYHLSLPPLSPRPYTGTPAAQIWVNSASQVAERLHQGQVDKAGVSYYQGHLSAVAALGRDWRERVVGYLHDSTEDTPYTRDFVLTLLEETAGASLSSWDKADIQRALGLLDHHAASSRENYIKSIVASPLATAVKLHDLKHNMEISRIQSPSPRDYERLERYQREFAFLSHYLRPPFYLD